MSLIGKIAEFMSKHSRKQRLTGLSETLHAQLLHDILEMPSPIKDNLASVFRQ